MEILTERGADNVLILSTVGFKSDEIVSQILKTRLPRLTAAIRRDVEVILYGVKEIQTEVTSYRTIWEIIKGKEK